MAGADAILLGSPAYFGDVSSEMKALIDRSGMVSQANGHIESVYKSNPRFYCSSYNFPVGDEWIGKILTSCGEVDALPKDNAGKVQWFTGCPVISEWATIGPFYGPSRKRLFTRKGCLLFSA